MDSSIRTICLRRMTGRSKALEWTAKSRTWATTVLHDLENRRVDFDGVVYELHAGAEYRDFGLVAGLQERHARVEVPAEHLGIGKQLAFYAGSRSERDGSHDAGPASTASAMVWPAGAVANRNGDFTGNGRLLRP